MYNLIITELIKLKRLKLLFIIPAGIIIPTVMGIMKWNNVRKSYGSFIGMNYEFRFVEQEMTNGILMIIIILIAINFFVNEYKNKEIENLFSYPYNRTRFMLAKLIAILIITSFIVLAIFLLSVIYGIFVVREMPELTILFYYFKLCLVIILLFFSVVPICAMACITSRSYVLPVVLAVLIYLLNPQLIEIAYLRVLPWNVPYYMILSMSMQLTLDPTSELFKIQNYLPYILSSILTFVVPTVFNLIYYSKMEIY